MMVSPMEADEVASDVPSENERKLDIRLSNEMKMWLERDFELVNLENKLVKLPSNPNIITILEDYFKTWASQHLSEISEKRKRKYGYRQRKNKINIDSAVRIVRICREVMDSIRISFDFTLPGLLLYNKEKEQYSRLEFNTMGEINLQSNDGKKENLSNSNLEREFDDSVSSPEAQFVILQAEQGETFPNEAIEGNQTVWNSCEELVEKEVNENPLSFETENERSFFDTTVVSSADNKTNENTTEYWEIKPDIILETSTDSDKSPTIKNENTTTCDDLSKEPALSVPVTNNENHFTKKKKENKRSIRPRFLTFTRITTRSMTKNSRSIKRVEIAKAYGILTNLLDKPLVPPKSDVNFPSCLYGPVHLARLFVKLPDILEIKNASNRKLKVITYHLHKFLSYLEGHPQWFSEENYEDSQIKPALLYQP